MRNLLHRFRALSPSARLTALLCAGAVALCLILPPAVFAVWDAVLLGGPQPRADTGQPFPLSDAARENSTACLLYDLARLQMTDSSQWPALALGEEELLQARARCADVLDRAQALGLLCPADAARLQTALESDGFALTARQGPAGMTAYSLTRREPSRMPLAEAPNPESVLPAATPETATPESATPESAAPADNLYLTLTLAPDGRPVAFSWQDLTRSDYFAPTDGLLEPAMDLLGVESFSDWQPAELGNRLPHAGEIAYSPTAQLYLSVNVNGGLTIEAASMTPDQFADLLA